MPKRRSDWNGGDRTAKPRRQRRRHLYLVLDDWSLGYSIRKIDLSSDFDCDDDSDQSIAAEQGPISHGSSGKQRLPSAIFRFVAQRGLPMYFAAAFGSKIMVMHPRAHAAINGAGAHPLVPKRLVPAFDVRMRSVILGPRQIPDPDDPIYIDVGGRLFALSTDSFELLDPPPVDESELEDWVWSWRELPEPPFKRKYVTSYTVHPDGRTIFVSIKKRRSAATFTFDTATAESALTDGCMWLRDGCTWKRHGKWMLPFTGRAYFDSALDAWVGLSADPGTTGQLCSCDVVPTLSDTGDGQLCSCDVVTPTSDAGDGQSPATVSLNVKLCKEVFSDNPAVRRVGATLLYIGSRSEFCLVECICIRDDSVGEMNADSVGENDDSVGDTSDDSVSETSDESVGMTSDDSGSEMSDCKMDKQHSGYLFRIKTFFLMYDKNGDLTTGNHIQVRCYDVPEEVSQSTCKYPVAFWM